MLVFDKCCCCIELRTGCFILGYLQLVAQAIMTIVSIIGIVVSAVKSAAPEEERREVGNAFFIAFIIIFLVMITFLAVTITFVVGLHKNKPGHVKIYLIFALVVHVLGLLLTLVAVIKMGIPWTVIIQQMFYILINAYYLLVIRSYWLLMLNRNPRPRASSISK